MNPFLRVEATNLNFIKQHQKKLRVEQDQGLINHVANITYIVERANVPEGISTKRQPSFERSPIKMPKRFYAYRIYEFNSFQHRLFLNFHPCKERA